MTPPCSNALSPNAVIPLRFRRRNVYFFGCLLLASHLSLGQSNAPTSVTLTNGDVISGALVEQSPATITLNNLILGKVVIPRASIATTSQALESLLAQSSVASSSPQTQVGKSTPAPNGLKLAKVKVSAGFLGATQKQQTYSGELDLVNNVNAGAKGWPHQRSLLMLTPTYDDKRNPTKPPANITRNYNAILQHILYTTSNNTYVPLLANWYHNNSLGIYLQQTYGGGFGKIIGPLELDADLRFIGEHFYTPPKSATPVPSLGLVGAGLSERYDIPVSIIRPGAKISEAIEFVPVFNHSAAWQGHGIVDVSIPFSQQWSFVVSAFDNYVQNAPPTFNKNYLKTTVGIQYSPAKKK